MKSNRVRSFRLDDASMERLERLAAAHKLSASEMLRRLLADDLVAKIEGLSSDILELKHAHDEDIEILRADILELEKYLLAIVTRAGISRDDIDQIYDSAVPKSDSENDLEGQ